MPGAVVVFCMPERGHWQRLVPLVRALVASGRPVVALTDARFAADATRVGARFVDLFAPHPIEAADATSIPVPSRYVTFAAHHAQAIAALVAAWRPGLIVHDTFAVIGPVVARMVGVPYVNVCAGHAMVPARTLARLRVDPRVATSAACLRAVERLRHKHGMSDASPFSYVDRTSPHLNVYSEPSIYLPEADRAAFAPLAFFGSVDPERPADGEVPFTNRRGTAWPGAPRVYASFGGVVWRYFRPRVLDALGAVAEALARANVDGVISLGDADVSDTERRLLERPRVRVARFVDQRATLAETDVFITHHGMNSTHEAAFFEVPMLSYPFFSDQPDLARRCEELGLALPLVAEPQAALAPDRVTRALATLLGERERFAERLAAARAWELETIAGRPAVVERVLSLALA